MNVNVNMKRKKLKGKTVYLCQVPATTQFGVALTTKEINDSIRRTKKSNPLEDYSDVVCVYVPNNIYINKLL